MESRADFKGLVEMQIQWTLSKINTFETFHSIKTGHQKEKYYKSIHSDRISKMWKCRRRH